MTENSYQKQEDLLLAMAIGKSDQQALSKLYDKYAPVLAGVISRIVQKDSLAEEVLQKVFQQVWSEAGSFDPSRHSLLTWLLKLTREVSFDTLRSTATINPTPTPDAEDQTGPVDLFIFDLVYFKGFHYTEVATTLNIPAENIKKYVRQAIKTLGQAV